MRRLVPLVAILAALCSAMLPAGAGAALKPIHLRQGLQVQALAAGPHGTLWAAGLDRTGEAPRIFVTWFAPDGKQRFFHRPAPAGSSGIADLVRGPEERMWFSVPDENTVARTGFEGHWQGILGPTEGRPAALVAVGNDVWATMTGRALISQIETMQPRELNWILEPETSLTRAVLGAEGEIWGLGAGSAELVQIDPKSKSSSYYHFIGGDPGLEGIAFTEIVAAEDGALWVTESGRALVGRITARKKHGGFEEIRFNLPGGPTELLSPGPAGDVWFAAKRGGVGSIAPDGEAGELKCATPGCAPVQALAPGPDGKLWFAAGRTIAPFEPRPLALTIPNVDGHAVTEKDARHDKQQIFMRLQCHGGAAGQKCPGRIELRSGGRRLQSFPYWLRSGSHTEEWVTLDASIRKLLAVRGRLPVALLATTEGGTTARRTFTLSATK